MHPAPIPDTLRLDSAAPTTASVYRVVRGDAIEPSRIRRTPTGGAIIAGCLGRPGVLVYQEPDGSLVNEWRPSREVLDPQALAQLNDAPVVADHPVDPATGEGGLVTPENHADVARGHVSAGSVRVENGLPWADLVIDPGPLLDDILSGRRTGLSLGYLTKRVREPGIVPEGEPDAGRSYDWKQVGPTRNNHVAVVSNPRAGAVASLRLDSAGNSCTLPVDSPPTERARMKTIRIGGIDYPLNTPAEIEAACAAQARVDAERVKEDAVRADSAAKAALEEKARFDAAVKVAVEKARADADDASAALVSAVLAAKRVLGAGYDYAGKTLEEIQGEVLAKAYPKMDLKGRTPEVLSALMEACEGAAGEPDGDEGATVAEDSADVGDVAGEPDPLVTGADAMPGKPTSTTPGGPPAVKTDSTGRRGTSLADVNAARLNGGGRTVRTDALTDEREKMIARDRQRGLEPLPSAR